MESGSTASFSTARWNQNFLDADDCYQLWSISRSNPKDTEGCRNIVWITTNRTEEHFWTALNGVSTFNVTLNGIEYVRCPAAPAGTQPLNCEFFAPASAGGGDSTAFIQFSYTSDQLVIFNRTQDRWMSLSGLSVAGLSMSDPALYTQISPVVNINQLAPGQCIVFGSGAPVEDCHVVGESAIFFWNAEFTLSGGSRTYTCPAAVSGKLTLCIMPR